MGAFDTCNVAHFDWLWQRYLPAHVSIGDSAFFRIRFLCLLHFSAIESKSGRSAARQLLEADIKNFGDALSRDAALVEFFAFPHVRAPSSHPSMSVIFKDEWRARLREQLAAFLPQRISLPRATRSQVAAGADASLHGQAQQISSICSESLDMLLSLSNSLPFLDAVDIQEKRSRLTCLNGDAGLSSQVNFSLSEYKCSSIPFRSTTSISAAQFPAGFCRRPIHRVRSAALALRRHLMSVMSTSSRLHPVPNLRSRARLHNPLSCAASLCLWTLRKFGLTLLPGSR